jgi:tetratricopeptide (TPR) repeat protein
MRKLTRAAIFLLCIAIAPFQGVAQTRHTGAGASLESAQALYAAGKFPEAIAVYLDYLAAHPGSEAAGLGLAECYRRVYNVDEARAALLLARKQHPKSVRVLKVLGNLEIEAQSYDAAIEALKAAVALAPDDLEARNFLGSAFQGKNELDSGLSEFNRVIAKDPGNQLAHYFRAQIYADTGKNDKAEADAEFVYSHRPNYLPGIVLLAKILVRQKQCARAVEILSPAHKAKQLDAQALFVLANGYDCAAQPEKAKAVRDEFAEAAQASHQHDENEVQSKHLVEQSNDFARQNKFPEAIELLLQALEKNPQNAFAYSQKAKILFSQRDMAGAREAIQQALALQAFQPDFLYVSGMIFEREGKPGDALEAFTKITRINPKEADAYFEIGQIRMQQGDRAAALNAFRKAATLEPDDADYRRAVEAASAPR